MCKYILIILLFLCKTTYAQILKKKYSVKKLTVENLLSDNNVETIFKDKEGFIWIGTQHGLNRYDGFSIKTYLNDPHNSNSISGNRITTISEDSDGYLWIGTTKGLSRFNKANNTFKSYLHFDKSKEPKCFQIMKIKIIENTLWICSRNGLLMYERNEDRFIRYLPEEKDTSFKSKIIYDIIKTKSNKLIIASENKCLHELKVKSKKFIPIYYTRNKYLVGNYKKHLLEDAYGNIWISSNYHGLVKITHDSSNSQIYLSNNKDLSIGLLGGEKVLLNDTLILLTTDGQGIIAFDMINEVFHRFEEIVETSDFNLDRKYFTILKDNQNIIWLGSFKKGVTILNPNNQNFSNSKMHFDPTLFNNKSILSIYEDSQKNIWIGTDGDGLFKIDTKGEIKNYIYNPDNRNSISSNRILCIGEFKSGNLILGTFNGGVCIYEVNEDRFTQYLPDIEKGKLKNIHVTSVCKNSENRVWLGYIGDGIKQFIPTSGEFVDYGLNSQNFNRTNNNVIHSIIQDKDGDIWFGTGGTGINVINKAINTMFHTFPTPNNDALINSEVFSFFQSNDNMIWIATDDGGIYKYDKKNRKLDHFMLSDHNNSNLVQSIIEGKNNELWLGMNSGLINLNTETNEYRYYNKEDGLSSNVFNKNAVYKLKNNTLIFGTTSGLLYILPKSYPTDTFVNNVYLTDLLVNNDKIRIGDEINGRILLRKEINFLNQIYLKSEENIFSIGYSFYCYTMANKCKIRYKLQGFEDSWIIVNSNKRSVTYTNLKPGNYIFKIEASNSSGIWNGKTKELKITILPSFVQSFYFKFIILSLSLILLYMIYKVSLHLKTKKIKQMHLESEKKAALFENEKLKSELNHHAFNIINKNRSLVELKHRLITISKRLDEKNYKSVNSIILQLNNELNKEVEWKQIEPRLDKVYNNFLTNLKSNYPKLSQTELRVCAYIRMGLSTKEISELMQKSLKAVENDRYRIRKKVHLPINQSLKVYFANLNEHI